MEQTSQWSVILLTPAMNLFPDLLKQNCYNGKPPGFLDENSDILTKMIMSECHLPNRSTGIPVYVHHLVIEFVCGVYFIFSMLCQITGGRRQNATKL